MTFTLTLEHDHEVIALRRTLLEGKFALDPDDNCIAGSPFVADILRKVFEHPMQSGPTTFPARDSEEVVNIARLRMAEAGSTTNWKNLSDDEREQLVNNVLAPFETDDELTSALIEHADKSAPAEFIEDQITNGVSATATVSTFDCVSAKLNVVVTCDDRSSKLVTFTEVERFTQMHNNAAGDKAFELRCETNGVRARFGIQINTTWYSFFANRTFTVAEVAA